MKTKLTLYRYDGLLFVLYDEACEHAERKIAGNYNNIDPTTTTAYEDECKEIEEIEVDFERYTDFTYDVDLLLHQINLVCRTTKDKDYLNRLIKELQIMVNRIGDKNFY